MLEALGGRKLIGSLVVTLIGVLITVVKGDVPANLQQLLEVVFGAFVLGNAAEHGALVIKGKAEAQARAYEANAQVQVANQPDNETKTSLKNLEQGLMLTQDLLQLVIRRTGIDKMPEPPK